MNIRFTPCPGAMRFKNADGEYVQASPHDPLYASVTAQATEFYDGFNWRAIPKQTPEPARVLKGLSDAIPAGPHPTPYAEWISVRLDFVQEAIRLLKGQTPNQPIKPGKNHLATTPVK